jgi:hypothetical protein
MGNVRTFVKSESIKKFAKPSPEMLKNTELNDRVKNYFSGRGISEATLQKFFIHGKEDWMPQSQKKERCIVFPYIRDNEIVNAKYRDGKKGFKLVKDAELIFFGMQTLQGRRCAIIVEGEIDALSAYEVGFAQDYEVVCNEDGEVVEHELGRFAVLSVPNGASKGNQRMEYLDNCAEYLELVEEFIIATDKGIFYKIRQAAPHKVLIEAPTAGHSATCRSCAHCPWMAMNGLRKLAAALRDGSNEIRVDAKIGQRAVVPIKRLLDFSAGQHSVIYGNNDA